MSAFSNIGTLVDDRRQRKQGQQRQLAIQNFIDSEYQKMKRDPSYNLAIYKRNAVMKGVATDKSVIDYGEIVREATETAIDKRKESDAKARQSQISQIGQQAQQPTKTQFTPEFDKALSTPPSQFMPSANPQAIQTPSQPAPTDTEGVLQKAGQIAAEQNIGPLSKEEQGVIAGTAGTQPAQQVATEQRQQKKDVAAAEQQKLVNERAQKRENRLQAEAVTQKVKNKQAVEKSKIDTAIKLYTIERKDVNDELTKKQQQLDYQKNQKGSAKNINVIDTLSDEITALEEAKKKLSTDIKDLIKGGSSATETKPVPTVQDISAKFGYLPPDQLSAIGDLLKNENPDTPGEMWTLDDIFKKFKATKPGYQAPSFGAQ